MSVKTRYNLLYFLYCVVGCCFGGFVAVFLQYKNVSNTIIGLITGTGCVTSIFLAPYLSGLVMKIKSLTVKKITTIIYIGLNIAFLFLALMPLPSQVVVVLFTIFYAIYISTAPFLQMLASDYMQNGYEIHFGLARGLGSTSWAISSLVFGFIIEKTSPAILTVGAVIFSVLMLGLLNSMPNVTEAENEGDSKENKGGSIFGIIKSYHIYFLLLVGFAMMLSAATSIGTYLINIVTSLGGNTSFYGVAVFIMALSEMPVMALTPRLMKKYKSTDLVLVGAICYGIRNFTICLSPNLVILCVGMVFQGLSFGLLTTVMTYYVIYNLKVEDQVMGQTMIAVMTTGFGSTLGNILGGFLQDNFGLGSMYIYVYTLTILGIIMVFIANRLSKTKKHQNEILR